MTAEPVTTPADAVERARNTATWLQARGQKRSAEAIRAILAALAQPAAPSGAEAIREAADLLEQYAGFIRDDVKADDLERHPYLPLVEQTVADLRNLPVAQPSEQPADQREGAAIGKLWGALDRMFVQAIQSDLNDRAHEYGPGVIAEARQVLAETKALATAPSAESDTAPEQSA